MSGISYAPPTEQLPIFDSSVFLNQSSVTTTVNEVNTIITAAVDPYYQLYKQFSAQPNNRISTVQFNFVGANWNINDFFTVNFMYSSNTTSNGFQTIDYQKINGSIDIYPARCPGNVGTNTAYGVGANGTAPTNFPLFNNNIWSGAGYTSAYSVPVDAVYAPSGRYFWTNNYTYAFNVNNLAATINPYPIQPYIASGSAALSSFGFGIWNYATSATQLQINQLSITLINRGPGGAGQQITISSTGTSGANIKTIGF